MFPLNVASATVGDKLNLTTQTFDSIDLAPGGDVMVSGVRLGSDGILYEVAGWNNAGETFQSRNQPTDWIDPKNNMANYEAMATSPDTMNWDLSNALNVWINGASQPQWGVQRTTPASGTTTGVITVQIRQIVTLSVKASGVYTCNATEL